MTTIELTDDQRQALQAEQGKPIDVVDPATHQRYVLIACEQYERVRALLEPDPRQESLPVAEGIPTGIFRSQQAFWRDLPELLLDRKNHGRWAAYHGDNRIGTAPTKAELVQAILRQGVARDEYYVGRIRPQALAPWEPVEVEPTYSHDVEDLLTES